MRLRRDVCGFMFYGAAIPALVTAFCAWICFRFVASDDPNYWLPALLGFTVFLFDLPWLLGRVHIVGGEVVSGVPWFPQRTSLKDISDVNEGIIDSVGHVTGIRFEMRDGSTVELRLSGWMRPGRRTEWIRAISAARQVE